eukprot:TRINITY_DN4464_c0_g1_i1.p1 TRINITY_DN4464_c0_g1~~TRINITY_DN4464_c0_g1_i1.p1  ORF type:complete len:607 (+),score=123.75 TRINITY_DN4464_c0_g1_i1:199-1821(+)
MWAAKQLDNLKELGITHILGCTSYGDIIRFHPNDFKYLVITLDDIPESDLSVHFHEATKFIQEAEEAKGKILVHCAQGRSRSATLVLAYLISVRKMTFRDALSMIQLRRPQCNPNPGFTLQLYKLEDSVLHSSRVLPKPGEIISHTPHVTHIHEKEHVRVLTWNIERGYPHRLPQIIDVLKRMDPDILFLHELDIFNKRTGDVDVCKTIADALNLNYVFITEYEELYSVNRTPELQGGGVHGSAILSKFPIMSAAGGLHEFQPFTWGPEHPVEPRIGGNVYVSKVVKTPIGDLFCILARLQKNTNMIARIRQFSEILQKIEEHEAATGSRVIPVIGGDLNTICNGLAKMLPTYSDHYSPPYGVSEAEWWQEHVFSPPVPRNSENTENPEKPEKSEKSEKSENNSTSSTSWWSSFMNSEPKKPEHVPLPYTVSQNGERIFSYNEDSFRVPSVAYRLQDPFSKTRANEGKLDWLLFPEHELSLQEKGIASAQYQSSTISDGLSDHLFLFVDLVKKKEEETKKETEETEETEETKEKETEEEK